MTCLTREYKECRYFERDGMFESQLLAVQTNFFDMFNRLSLDLECNPFPKTLDGYPKGLTEFFSTLYTKNNQSTPTLTNPLVIPKIDIKNNKKILVACSGGKDSLATVLELKDMGYEPVLFHVPNLNRAYPSETKLVREWREIFDCEYVEFKMVTRGKNFHVETPIKNFFILGAMVDVGIHLGISNFSMGNKLEDTLDLIYLGIDFSDNIQSINEISNFYKTIIPNYEYKTVLECEDHPTRIIHKKDERLFDACVSCMLSDMYKNSVRVVNDRKFGDLGLSKLSCGSCRKCVSEYLTKGYIRNITYNKDYLEKTKEIMYKFAVMTGVTGGKTFRELYKLILTGELLENILSKVDNET